MDTLCIPPINYETQASIPDLQSIKNMAIEKMNAIYAGAAATLVLDSEIRNIAHLPNTVTDIMTVEARILFCGWSTRSWTLQESSLSPATLFALDKDVYNSTSNSPAQGNASISDAAIKAMQRQIHDLFLSSQLPLRNPIRRLTSAAEHDSELFCLAWNAMLDRSSTQTASVPAILANILRISSSRILELPEAQRVPTLIRNQNILPIDMLYNTGSRVHANKSTATARSQAREKQSLKWRAWQMLRKDSWRSSDLESSVSRFEITQYSSTPSQARNRWVPSSISGDFWTTSQPLSHQAVLGDELGGFGTILLNQHDRLHLPKDSPRGPTVLILRNQIIRSNKYTLAFTKARRTIRILVEQVLQSGDDLVKEKSFGSDMQYCFLIDCRKWSRLQEGQGLQGARLRVLETTVEGGKHPTKTFNTTHDCPLRITFITEQIENCPEYDVTQDQCHAINILYCKPRHGQ